jgi:hypothetical protein
VTDPENTLKITSDIYIRSDVLLSLWPSGFHNASADQTAIVYDNDLTQMDKRYAELSVPVDVLFGNKDAVLNWIRHGEALRLRSNHVTDAQRRGRWPHAASYRAFHDLRLAALGHHAFHAHKRSPSTSQSRSSPAAPCASKHRPRPEPHRSL